MPNTLLVYPRNPVTFWSFDEALRMVGKKSAFPPLGLLTIAGMMPAEYDLRLVDVNVRPLRDEDLDWADIVITSSMIIHRSSLEEIVGRCNARGVPVLNGGPLPTQYHDEIAGDAAFYLGEAENGFLDVVERLVTAPLPGGREVVDRRGQFRNLDVTSLPRWDLIDFDDYATMLVQITRGCPESCTFCNIPSLYGKTTRLKSKSRVIHEFEALYDAGWRGSIMVVDDNLVGNRDAIRITLEEEVIPWQRERGYPFQLNTQASIRLSDDPALLEAMRAAGFDKIFTGIESPVTESLKFMGAQKNLQGGVPLIDKVRTLQRHGFEVQAGFIIGLDTDPDDIADRLIAFIEEAGIPVAMAGILGVLRDTPDYKRFERAGRLVEGNRYSGDSGIFSRELSFVPAIDADELLDRHRQVVETINSPGSFFERCLTLFQRLERSPLPPFRIGATELKAVARSVWRQGVTGSYRRDYWRFLGRTLRRHPRRLQHAVTLAVHGHHLIVTTRQALQVDDVNTFLAEALDCLERYRKGYRQVFRRNVGSYASRLMRAIHDRFEHGQDDLSCLQHNAAVLLAAAQEYHDALREEFRYQVRDKLERLQSEIESILGSYALEALAQRIS